VFIVISIYFVIDSVRKLLDTNSYVCMYVLYTSTFLDGTLEGRRRLGILWSGWDDNTEVYVRK